MEGTLIFWTHETIMPCLNANFVDAKKVNRFKMYIDALKEPKARNRYRYIIVSSFNQMQISFGLQETGELLEELASLEREYDYTIIILPHSKDIQNYSVLLW